MILLQSLALKATPLGTLLLHDIEDGPWRDVVAQPGKSSLILLVYNAVMKLELRSSRHCLEVRLAGAPRWKNVGLDKCNKAKNEQRVCKEEPG